MRHLLEKSQAELVMYYNLADKLKILTPEKLAQLSQLINLIEKELYGKNKLV